MRTQNPKYKGFEIIDSGRARSLYRSLSNIIHGKMTTFESVLPDRFEHNKADWRLHLERVCEVETLMLALWENRFQCVSERLVNDFPQLRMLRTNANESHT